MCAFSELVEAKGKHQRGKTKGKTTKREKENHQNHQNHQIQRKAKGKATQKKRKRKSQWSNRQKETIHKFKTLGYVVFRRNIQRKTEGMLRVF